MKCPKKEAKEGTMKVLKDDMIIYHDSGYHFIGWIEDFEKTQLVFEESISLGDDRFSCFVGEIDV